MMPISSAVRSPPVSSATPSAISPIAPVSSSAPTITNRPMKKNSVAHSIPASEDSSGWVVTSSSTVAPSIATVAGSRCSGLCTKKSRIVPIRTGSARLSSSGSSIERRASSSITRSRASGAICSRGPEPQVQHARHDEERHDRDRGEVDQELDEAQPGRAGDHDVRRVADQRRGAADVRRDDLDHHQWQRVDVERVREQERDRHHQQHRREVVQERAQQRRRPGEREHDEQRTAARELAGADRQVGVDAGRLGQPDDQHHPRQQPERVEVDRADRLLLADRLRHHDCHGAGQRDLGPVDLLADDDRPARRRRSRSPGPSHRLRKRQHGRPGAQEPQVGDELGDRRLAHDLRRRRRAAPGTSPTGVRAASPPSRPDAA